MFSRKISRVQKRLEDAHPQVHNLPKRSSLMCLPENSLALKQSRTPPPRIRSITNKRSQSVESVFPQQPPRKDTKHMYFTDQMMNWSLSLKDLLSDRQGLEMFVAYLEMEHSAENIQFWIECQKYKSTPSEDLPRKARQIYEDFLSDKSRFQINIDSSRLKEIEQHLEKPNAWTFDRVEQDIFLLMKRDSYPRFLKSDMYLNQLNGPNCLHTSLDS